MAATQYQIIGRRLDRPQAVLFRDDAGRHFLRADCGAPLVRLTNRDAAALMRHRDYHPVLDGSWRSLDEAVALDCVVQFPLPADRPPVHP